MSSISPTSIRPFLLWFFFSVCLSYLYLNQCCFCKPSIPAPTTSQSPHFITFHSFFCFTPVDICLHFTSCLVFHTHNIPIISFYNVAPVFLFFTQSVSAFTLPPVLFSTPSIIAFYIFASVFLLHPPVLYPLSCYLPHPSSHFTSLHLCFLFTQSVSACTLPPALFSALVSLILPHAAHPNWHCRLATVRLLPFFFFFFFF